MQQFGILSAVFIFVSLSVVGVFFVLFSRSENRLWRKRLSHIHGPPRTSSAPKLVIEEGSLFREELVRGSPILSLLRSIIPGGLSDLGARLEKAGMSMGPRHLARAWVVMIFLGGLVGMAFPAKLAGLILGILFGAIAPSIFLHIKKVRREKAFEQQFPEALRLLSTSLKAGHALPVSIRMLGEELPPPVSIEFQKASEETRLGMRMEDALKNMLARIDSQDLRFFVTSVIIQRETGGNLSDVLEQLDAIIRERFKIRRQVKAITAPSRMAGYMLAVLPIGVGLMFSIINPEYMEPLWATPLGRFVAIAAFVLQAVGYLVIRRIVNFKF
ncbi:MAG: type II secretion system F family protein [Nitrospinota bacterium]